MTTKNATSKPTKSKSEKTSSAKASTKSAKKSARKSSANASTTSSAKGKSSNGFTAEERAAMKERAKEAKAASGRGGKKADGESEVLAKIAAMEGPDRALAERLHAIVKASAPELTPRTWYGMPAYEKDGKVVCFFQDAKKFKARYATLGFNDKASLDDGAMWPTAFALKELTPEVEKRIAALVKQAVG